MEQNQAVVRVNDSIITEKDLQEKVNLTINQQYFHRNLSPEKEKAVKKQALEILIEEELFYQEALKQKIEVKKTTVEEELNKAIKRFRSKTDFKTALNKLGYTEKEFWEKLERELIIKAFYQKYILNKTKFSDEDLNDYYIRNKENFIKPESINLQHILIKAQDQTSDKSWQEAEEKADHIMSLLKQGESFDDLAAQHSDDRYRIKGGRLGWVHRGRLLPEIEKIAFDLKKGDLGGHIKSRYGFHIIKLIDKQTPQQLEFSEIQDKLRQDLQKKYEAETKQKLLEDLKNKAKIEILIEFK